MLASNSKDAKTPRSIAILILNRLSNTRIDLKSVAFGCHTHPRQDLYPSSELKLSGPRKPRMSNRSGRDTTSEIRNVSAYADSNCFTHRFPVFIDPT